MLGKLAKYLRMLGFDVRYEKEPNLTKMVFSAAIEGRIIITRNTKFKEKANSFFLQSENLEEQLAMLLKKFNLLKDINFGSRCLICNSELKKVANKEEVRGKVPFFVFQTKDEFSYCPICKKFFWQGTHYKNMKKFVEEKLIKNKD